MVTPNTFREVAFAALCAETPYTLADLPMAAPAMGVPDGAALDAFPLVPFEGALYAVRALDGFDGDAPATGQTCAFCLSDDEKSLTFFTFWFGPMPERDELHALQNELPGGCELDVVAVAIGFVRAKK